MSIPILYATSVNKLTAVESIDTFQVNANVYLSGGVNLLDILSGGGGGTGRDDVNTAVISNSANWNTAYNVATAYQSVSGDFVNTTILNSVSSLLLPTSVYQSASGNWQGTFTTVQSNSSNWNNAYNTGTVYQSNSASYATNDYVNTNFLALSGGTVQGPVRINNNLTVFGNLTATGTTTFANTIFSVTSSLSVVHIGSGPALYVGNNGDGDIASFYDIDQGIEILHVGGINSSFPNVGIKVSSPNKDFTVNGEISANSRVYASGLSINNQATNANLVLRGSDTLQTKNTIIVDSINREILSFTNRGTLVITGRTTNNTMLSLESDQSTNPNLMRMQLPGSPDFQYFGAGYIGAAPCYVFLNRGGDSTSPLLVIEDNLYGSQGRVGIGVGNNVPNEKLTVIGNISATGIVYALSGNSNQWNQAYNISTVYQSASSSYATNSLVNSVSSLLTPLTLTNTLTGQLVTNTAFANYQTSVAGSTATLLPTSIYQSASGNWQTAYTNLVSNSAAYLSGVNLTFLQEPSANWNSTYTTVQTNSSNWQNAYNTATVYQTNSSSYATNDYVNDNFFPLSGGTLTGNLSVYGNTFINNNLTIGGNLTALGTATFANTIFTTTSALSVYNTGPGPALYVYQAAGPYDVASFYDGDGIEVLHVGNAGPGGFGKVGVNESFPNEELTVRGSISATEVIYAENGNSTNWNTAYLHVSSQSLNTTDNVEFNQINANVYLSGGTNLLNILSSSGGGGGDPAVNTVVYTYSATWIDTSTVVQTNSASWAGGGGSTEKRFDFVTTGGIDYSYSGTAPQYTIETSPMWKLIRLTYNNNGTISNSASALNSWTGRLTATYV